MEKFPGIITTTPQPSAQNLDLCCVCGQPGRLVCCDFCPRSLHHKCISGDVPKKGAFACVSCRTGGVYGFSLGDVDLRQTAALDKYLALLVPRPAPRSPACAGDGPECVTLGQMLQYLETVSPNSVPALAKAVATHFQLERMLRGVSDTDSGDKRSSSLLALQARVRLIAGPAWTEALDYLAGGRSARASCLAVTPGLLTRRCPSCRRERLLHCFCFACGVVFDAKLEALCVPGLQGVIVGGRHTQPQPRGTLTSAQAQAALELRHLLATEGLAAAERGVEYFFRCSEDEAVFAGHGGDILFLMRNLAACSTGPLRPRARRLFRRMLQRWREGYTQLPTEGTPECSEVLNLMEGLHACCQAERPGSIVAQLLQEADADDTEGVCGVESSSQDSKRRRSEPGSSQQSDARTGEESEGGTRSLRRRVSGGLPRGQFDLATVCAQVQRHLSHFDLSDIMGFNPLLEPGLPTSPRAHCGHCGRSDNSSHAHDCRACQQPLRSKIDYGCLADAVVWAYVFHDVGVPLRFRGEPMRLEAVFRLLPLARCYQRVDELGVDFFKLQCFFLTHLIYVFSDWGQHGLHRQLFAEEFEFIVGNMALAVGVLRDPEIVGEFLQCLKIMHFTPETDPELVPLVLLAVRFLIREERDRGCKGVWVSRREQGSAAKWCGKAGKMYDTYHTSYCASVALMDYYFMDDAGLRKNPREPTVLRYL